MVPSIFAGSTYFRISTTTMDTKTITRDSIKILNTSSLKALIPMPLAIDLMGTAFRFLSDKSAYVPPRVVMSSQDESMSVFFKPAFLQDYNRMSIKILTQIHNKDSIDTATIKGMILLVDLKTGSALSLTDGSYATALRTGAASGIATRLLSDPEASVVAIFGCGAQGRTQLEAVRAVRRIQTIFLYDTSRTQAEILASEILPEPGLDIRVNPGPEALKYAQVICTATPSTRPLFERQHITPGVHINAIGSYRPDMQEIDPYILGQSKIYLDHAEACLGDSGDLLNPLNGGIINPDQIKGEIGLLVAGKIKGREKPDDITVFKSVGSAVQDFFIANEAYELSQGSLDINWINFTD